MCVLRREGGEVDAFLTPALWVRGRCEVWGGPLREAWEML